jgi:error-prone DNA polymerase
MSRPPSPVRCSIASPWAFYAPAQLVQDARRHGVTVRPVDVRTSFWDCTLEPLIGHAQPALRLGLRMVKGLSQAGSRRLLEAKALAVFSDVADLARRARLDRKDLACLAAADTLRGLAGDRYQAQWQVLGVEEPLPVLADPGIREAIPMLRPPTEGDNIVRDYACLGLTVRRHPLAVLRPQLERLHLRTADRIGDLAHGQAVRTGGLVINRQRPGTATGVVFLTMEDETGYINVVVWNRLVQRQRRVLLGARLLIVVGEVQREDGVVHVIARHLEDHSPLLGRLVTHSRDFH